MCDIGRHIGVQIGVGTWGSPMNEAMGEGAKRTRPSLEVYVPCGPKAPQFIRLQGTLSDVNWVMSDMLSTEF